MHSEIKDKLENLSVAPAGAPPEELRQLEEENRKLRKKVSKLEDDIEQGAAKGGGGGGGGDSGASSEEVAGLKADIENLKAAITAYENNKDSKFGTGQDGDRERAQLMMRCTKAEAELKTFQALFKSEVAKYQSKLSKAKKEIASLKK